MVFLLCCAVILVTIFWCCVIGWWVRGWETQMCLFHKWGPWYRGTSYETLDGVRTGRKKESVGRDCEKCGRTKVKDRYL